MSWNKCGKCGRELNGLQWNYGNEWDCCDCAVDKSDVLHAERGCRVKALYLDWGYSHDKEKAHKYLKQDGIYTIQNVEVNRSSTNVELQEFPKMIFNSIHFLRIEK